MEGVYLPTILNHQDVSYSLYIIFYHPNLHTIRISFGRNGGCGSSGFVWNNPTNVCAGFFIEFIRYCISFTFHFHSPCIYFGFIESFKIFLIAFRWSHTWFFVAFYNNNMPLSC